MGSPRLVIKPSVAATEALRFSESNDLIDLLVHGLSNHLPEQADLFPLVHSFEKLIDRSPRLLNRLPHHVSQKLGH